MKLKKKLNFLKVFLVLAVASVVLFLLYYFFIFDNDVHRFQASARTLLQKSKALAKKAQYFNQEAALKSIGKVPINGFYYRFDDSLHKARIGGRPHTLRREPYLVNIDFNEADAQQLLTKEEKFSISGGILKINHQAGAYIEFPVIIPYDRVGKIEIRARHGKGKILRFGWSRHANKKLDTKKTGFTDIDVIPGNNFHVYSINAKHVLKRKLSFGGIIKKIYLFASDIHKDRIEIDYIRFVTKKGEYLKRPVGIAYEAIDKEIRKVIFTQTPLSLTYELELPKENSFIRFGMGKIENDDPVTFKILVAGSSEIFSHTLDSPGWHDARIDMSAYKEKKLEITFTTDSQKGNIALWSNPVLYTLPKKKFNVIIVLEDALRADHMSMYGSSRKTTPVKKRFAKKGVLFLNAFAQAPKTRASCASIMTSLHPTATRVWKFSESLHDNYLTLAEILRYAGFQTAAFIQNPNGGPSIGLHQGFGHLYTAFSKTNYKGTIYDHKALEWIKRHNESNYFLYLHLVDLHAPYNPPGKFRGWYRQAASDKIEPVEKNKKYDPKWVAAPTKNSRRTLYDGEIRNNDFHFARFLAGLKELNSIHHTLIIFISDHGEHLGEHDNLGIHSRWGHGPPNYIQVIKTPLIMVYPEKLPPNLVITQPVQNLDIVPTILDLLKINRDNLLLAGDSLLPLIHQKKSGYWNNRLIVSDETINRKNWEEARELASLIYKDTHILSSYKLPVLQFNYVNDKDEINGVRVPDNLKVLYKTFIRDLKNTHFTIWQGVTKNSSTRIKYDPDTIKRLKSLGYIQ